MKYLIISILAFITFTCTPDKDITDKDNKSSEHPFIWENATVYFMLTDRFFNGDPTNDTPLGRKQDGGLLRSFMGGDIKGITMKIKEDYFSHRNNCHCLIDLKNVS